MKKYDFLVVGGGFQGIVAAALLKKKYKNIAVLERMNGLGGIMRGIEHNGLILDFGCHLFNNDESEITALMLEILGDNYHPVSVKYAGVTQGHKREEMAVPSFAFWPEEKKQTVFDQMLTNAKAREGQPAKDFDSLYEWLVEHYGDILAPEIQKILEKSCGHNAKELSADNIYKTQVACVHLLEAEDFLLPLKKSLKELDKVIALPSQKDQMRFYREAEKDFKYRTFYPSKNGMRGFTDAAHDYLAARNVDFLLGKSIKSIKNADTSGVIVELEDGEVLQVGKLVWTLDIGMLSSLVIKENAIAPYLLKVPATLFYYFINKEAEPKYTYIQDFSPDTKMYRASAAGFYGHQVNDKNQSYICVEVPSQPESDLWQNPEKYSEEIWEEIKTLGMSDLDQPEETYQMSTPATFPMYRKGYKKVQIELSDYIEKTFPDIININMNAYTKNDIVRVISRAMKDISEAA